MLSERELFDARESAFAPKYRAEFSELERFEIDSLRAVEAAVRADQIDPEETYEMTDEEIEEARWLEDVNKGIEAHCERDLW